MSGGMGKDVIEGDGKGRIAEVVAVRRTEGLPRDDADASDETEDEARSNSLWSLSSIEEKVVGIIFVAYADLGSQGRSAEGSM